MLHRLWQLKPITKFCAEGTREVARLSRSTQRGEDVTCSLRASQMPEQNDSPWVVASVCARGGSKGVPRKNLRLMAGKPLLAHTVLQAQQCSRIQQIVGSTDDPEIAATMRQYGVDVSGLRPRELATDSANKWNVFRHIVSAYEKKQASRRIDVLADLDTGAVLRTPEDIDACVQTLLNSDADVCVTAYEADHNPYYNMVECDRLGRAQVCMPRSPAVVNRQQAPSVYNLSPAIFAIKREALWKFDHWSEAKMCLCVIPRERAVDIDTEFDFKLVEFLLASRS